MAQQTIRIGSQTFIVDTATGSSWLEGSQPPASAGVPAPSTSTASTPNGLPLGQLRTAEGTSTFLIGPDGRAVIVSPGEAQGLLSRGYKLPTADQQAWVQNEQASRNPGYYLTTDQIRAQGATSSGAAAAGGSASSGGGASSAQALAVLNQYDLGELAGYVDQAIRAGRSWDEVWLELIDPNTEPGRVVDRIYPELREVREAGLPPVTIADVLNTRQLTFEGLSQRGVERFLDPRALARQWIVGATSVSEGLARVDTVLDDVLTFARNDPQTRGELEAWERYYQTSMTAQDLLGLATRPDVTLSDLRRRAEAVRFDVEAGRAGFGDLARSEAEGLSDLGVEARSSGGTFGALVENRELFSALDRGEDAISRQEQLSAGFGNSAAARKRIEDRRRRRQAMFEGGGGVAVTREGFGGLRPA